MSAMYRLKTRLIKLSIDVLSIWDEMSFFVGNAELLQSVLETNLLIALTEMRK
jgi:hypothetical protein